MVRKNLEIFRNTSKVYELRFKRQGMNNDITGWTIYFTVKENMIDTDVNAKIKKDITTHPDGKHGIALIEISSSETDLPEKAYYYDIKFKDENDNVGILFSGRLEIKKPVTLRI